jgi:hypothetical protein
MRLRRDNIKLLRAITSLVIILILIWGVATIVDLVKTIHQRPRVDKVRTKCIDKMTYEQLDEVESAMYVSAKKRYGDIAYSEVGKSRHGEGCPHIDYICTLETTDGKVIARVLLSPGEYPKSTHIGTPYRKILTYARASIQLPYGVAMEK